MNETIRVLVCDDHAVVREGLRALIATEPGIEIAGEAADGESAVEQFRSIRPDVTLLDIMMPRLDGLAVIHRISDEFPEARILVLTSFTDDDILFPAIKAGARGYLLKDTLPDELIRAIRDVNSGKVSLHPGIARRLIQELRQPTTLPPTKEPLTERELDVLKLVAKGMSNEEIAAALIVSERTARGHVSSILSKLHLANRTQAALYALREGYATLGDES